MWEVKCFTFMTILFMKVGSVMRSSTMIVNGFELSYVVSSVSLDDLSLNPDNSRTDEEQTENAQRIYDSMCPAIDSKTRRVAYRADKLTLYVVKFGKTGVRVMCGNGTLGALQLWSEADSETFLKQFPDRMIPASMFDKLSPVEMLALAADHSTGFNSKELSTEQTALEFRRMMDRCKKDSLQGICAKLGYSTGKGKVYYHLEIAHRDCPELHMLLWAGAILREDGNKIRTTHIPSIAAQWALADGFAHSNTALWELVEAYRVFGNSKSKAPAETATEKLATVQAYRDKLVDVNTSNESLSSLVAAVVAGDYAGTKAVLVALDKALV